MCDLLSFVDDFKGELRGSWSRVYTVTSRDGSLEKENNYTTITIAHAGDGLYVVAKESRYKGGPVRRLWKKFRGEANVRRYLGDGPLSVQALTRAGMLAATAGRSLGG